MSDQVGFGQKIPGHDVNSLLFDSGDGRRNPVLSLILVFRAQGLGRPAGVYKHVIDLFEPGIVENGRNVIDRREFIGFTGLGHYVAGLNDGRPGGIYPLRHIFYKKIRDYAREETPRAEDDQIRLIDRGKGFRVCQGIRGLEGNLNYALARVSDRGLPVALASVAEFS